MKETNITIRDILAMPFWFAALVLDGIAVNVGGRWTREMFREHAIKIGELYKRS